MGTIDHTVCQLEYSIIAKATNITLDQENMQMLAFRLGTKWHTDIFLICRKHFSFVHTIYSLQTQIYIQF